MKFIVHNLRMIWARLSNSGWVLADLFLVFIVMWFLCDSLGCMKYTFYRPLGYDIDHVYRLTTVRGLSLIHISKVRHSSEEPL